ncbi:MAG: PLDc N-terminal domain-containing protein [Bacteroidota bacterium]|uniref:Phospholipase_D-nuclease N-terminal n=1 Tax=Algoriphagus faecimaris TaxID=686796 RepID=A0A1G6V514_9BACT|nr:PLD nuclease N-terminal domain-containing protein [Algoriphagus faecimaris]SDD48097.1 Phospholipase_D-nuclease N-terminal [Algoriphagus faecimaris]
MITFIMNMGGSFLIFGLLYLILWIYCLVDIIRSDFKDQNMKLIWVLIILFAQVLGPIAYLILGKNSKINAY